jgi:glyoxylase-like metal-dependent hydrolase (beta-lactamase superfamily II)
VLEAYEEEWGFEFQALLAGGQAGMGTYDRLITGLPDPTPPLVEDETPAELRDPWRVSLHFGHAEGHACLHWEQGGMLVSGDQLLPTISSNISLYPDIESADPLGDFFDSLDRLDLLPPDTIVLPAHGLPFRGVQARIAALRAEHEGRLVEIEKFCAEPREVGEIVAVLFGRRKLDGMNRLLAYGETLAHVRHLKLRGRIARVKDGGTVKWLKA